MYAFGVNFKTVRYIVTVSALLFLWNIECTEISDGKLESKDTQIPKNDFQVPFWLNKAARTAQPLENIDEADATNIPASPVRVIKNKDGKVGISENTILHSGNIHAPRNDYRVPFWLNEATRTAHPLEDIDDGYENNVLHSMNNIRKKVGIAEDAILHPESMRAVRNDFRVPFWLNKEARTAHSVEEVDEDYGNNVPYSLDKAADDDDDEQNSIVGFAEDAISDLAFDGSSTHLDDVDSNHKNSQTNEIREFYVIDREPKDSLDGEDLITKPRIRGVLTIDVVSQYPANGKKTACPITGVKLRCGFKKCNWDEDKFSVEEGGKGSNSIKLRIHSENDEDFYAYIISVFTKC